MPPCAPPHHSDAILTCATIIAHAQDMVPQLYDIPNSERSEYEVNALRQVRMCAVLWLEGLAFVVGDHS